MDYKETAIDYLSCDPHATFYTCEAKWMREIRRLQKEYPDDVIIFNDSEEFLEAHIPKSWMKIKPPRKMTLTDEQRLAAGERMKNARKNKKGAK